MKTSGVNRIDIPLATFITSGEVAKSINFDRRIVFYGDMLDLGLVIKSKSLNCFYDSSIIFNHKNITPIDSSPNQHRSIEQWQYISEKWLKAISINGHIYTPQLAKKTQQKNENRNQPQTIFIVELNYYHWEVVVSLINILNDTDCNFNIIALGDKCGTLKALKERVNRVHLSIFKTKSLALAYLKENVKSVDTVLLSSAGEVSAQKHEAALSSYTLSHLDAICSSLKKISPKILAIHHDIAVGNKIKEFNHTPICLNPTASKVHNIQFLSIAVPIKGKKLLENKLEHTKWIGLIGLLEKKRRDYESIINSFIEFVYANPETRLRIKIAGFCPIKEQPFWNALESLIISKGLSAYIDTSMISFEGRLTDIQIQKVLDKLTYLAYGINPFIKEQFSYIYSKMTGSYPLSLSNCLVPIIDKKVSTAYKLNGLAITYDDCSNISGALQVANNLNDYELSQLRQKIYDHCTELADQSRSYIHKLIKEKPYGDKVVL